MKPQQAAAANATQTPCGTVLPPEDALPQQLRSEALELLAQGFPLAEVLGVIARGIEARIPASTCAVMLLDRDKDCLRVTVVPDLPHDFRVAVDGMTVGEGSAVCGTAAWRGERVVVDDVTRSVLCEPYLDYVKQAGVVACWSEPILDPMERVLGTFAVYLRHPVAAEPERLACLTAASRLASVAIQQHQQQLALRNSQALLRMVIDEYPGIIILKDWNGRFLLGNRALAELYGTTPDDLVGKDDGAFNPNAAQVAGYLESLRDVIREGRTCYVEEDSTDATTGQVRHYHSIKKPLSGDNGEPRLLIIATDVTDLREARRRLEESQRQLSYVQAAIGEGVWDWNVTTDRVSHNLRWCELMGLDASYLEHPLTEFLTLLHPEDRERVTQGVKDCLAGKGPYASQHRLRHKDGHYIWVRDRGNVVEYTPEGAPLRMIGSIADITDRVSAENYLRLTASVFRHAHEGIVITDTEACIVEVNDTFCTITGYGREEVIGRNTRFLRSGHQPPEFYAELWRSLLEDGVWQGEMWNRKKNGELYAQLGNISAVRDESGKVTHYVGLFSDITALKESQRHLEHLAYHDALTQLPNRSLLADRMQMALAQAERSQELAAVAYLDLDGFKPVNDTLGHEAGDALLVEIARRLQSGIRAGDTVARMGGDEFALIYNGLIEAAECDQVFQRLLASIAEPVIIGGREIQVSASIGVTLFPLDGSDPDTLLRHADQAMYLAKQLGGNCFHLFDPERDRRLRAHREALVRVESALYDGELELHYQPKIDIRDNRLIGVESLIRWRHPDRGLLRPGEFLPVVIDSGFEIELGNWVLATAVDQIHDFCKLGRPVPISVNVSPRHLSNPDFVPFLASLLEAHPALPAGLLELEILESTSMADIGAVAEIMAACRRLGVSFALDDFGTGYASLTYLRRLPVQTVKIDQTFVRDMLEDADDLAIVQGVIGLAAAFHREVIAEGVETAEHSKALLALGCHLIQGNGVARPMSADQLIQWIKDGDIRH